MSEIELLSLLIPITICVILMTFISFVRFIDYLIKSWEDTNESKENELKKDIKNDIIDYFNHTKK